MADFDPRVAQALNGVIEELRETDPDIMDILNKAKSGDMTEEVAMANLLETVASNPETSKRFQALMLKATAGLRVVPDLEEKAVGHFGFTPRGGQGVPGINPLMQGALVERVQFDGDMPELRTGPIGQGIAPAVPVQTTARNPVAIGEMLGRASNKVQKQLQAGAAERRAEIEFHHEVAKFLETDEHTAGLKAVWGSIERNNPSTTDDVPTALTIMREHGALVAQEDAGTVLAGTAATDPDGYRRGEVPKPIAVTRPTGASLAKMTEPQRHEMAWRFLSTTQGRVSAVQIIRATIAALLQGRGLDVDERDFDSKAPRVQPCAYAEWSLTLAGPGATQPAFALVDVSSKVLAQRLYQGLTDPTQKQFWLEVEPVNRLADREVGWMARLMPRGV